MTETERFWMWVAIGLALGLLVGCSSAPEQPLFAGHDAPEHTGWVLHRMSDGSIHADPKFDGVPYHGVHALGEGEDFWDDRGETKHTISLTSD